MKPDADARSTKANFDAIYDRADPRAYYKTLAGLGYEVPHHGQRVFGPVLEALANDEPTVVDLCCSYGVTAALLKHDISLDEIYEHHLGQPATLSRDELVAADRELYAQRRRPDAPRVVGLDVSIAALDYAREVGLLDAAAAEDLEDHRPSSRLAAAVADADVITVTGGIGYIGERTFDRLLACMPAGRRPWVAALCLRTVPYAPIAAALQRHGLVTERLEGQTFPQRRFADDQERDYALRSLAARGLDPTGKESEGAYHVDVYLSRPAADAADQPIETVLAGLG